MTTLTRDVFYSMSPAWLQEIIRTYAPAWSPWSNPAVTS